MKKRRGVDEVFTCDMCKGVFLKGRADADALKEARQRHGQLVENGPLSIVCDDCHQKLCKHYGWKP